MIAVVMLIIVSLSKTSSERVEMQDDIFLDWSLEEGFQISFSLNVPELITTTYDWISIGFKLPQEGADMVNADGVVIDMTNSMIRDIYSISVGISYPDIILDGYEDVETSLYVSQSGGTITYYWSRNMDTEDDFDIKFTENESYLLLYAFGSSSDSYTPSPPDPVNTGYVEFKLEQESSYLVFLTSYN